MENSERTKKIVALQNQKSLVLCYCPTKDIGILSSAKSNEPRAHFLDEFLNRIKEYSGCLYGVSVSACPLSARVTGLEKSVPPKNLDRVCSKQAETLCSGSLDQAAVQGQAEVAIRNSIPLIILRHDLLALQLCGDLLNRLFYQATAFRRPAIPAERTANNT